MNLALPSKLADSYHSSSQRIRVMTEGWVGAEILCPSCGSNLRKYQDNKPVADFYCNKCVEDYELKSKQGNPGIKIVDGAYRTMIERLRDHNQPNFFFLNYDLNNFEVVNFIVIPKHFFVPEMIEKRNPLASTARRAGWIGCNILLEQIPQSGRIYYIRNREVESIEDIMWRWAETLFLREEKDVNAKGWIMDIMHCIDKLNKNEFSLPEMYNFEKELQVRHPKNKHIKDKIRQQLQFLRDKGYLEFVGKGRYRMRF